MGEWEYLHLTHPAEVFANEFDNPLGDRDIIALKRQQAYLRPEWHTLHKETLPFLAHSKSPSQPHWPVHLDHCFARIIFDAVIGNSTGKSPTTPEPWTTRLEAPALQNMHPRQLEECIELGKAIADGSVDLVELDRQSLAVRGKLHAGGKRRRDGDTAASRNAAVKRPRASPSRSQLKAQREKQQPDIRTALGISTPSTPTSSKQQQQQQPPPPATVPRSITHCIITAQSLTPFRRRVLLALCQVPRGQHTTYLALSNHLHSSPRAVGNALRNNPFAPEVPCHRVVAADGGIGGFRGEWGVDGRWCEDKVRLLREEGVAVERDGGRVRGRAWEGFV